MIGVRPARTPVHFLTLVLASRFGKPFSICMWGFHPSLCLLLGGATKIVYSFRSILEVFGWWFIIDYLSKTKVGMSSFLFVVNYIADLIKKGREIYANV